MSNTLQRRRTAPRPSRIGLSLLLAFLATATGCTTATMPIFGIPIPVPRNPLSKGGALAGYAEGDFQGRTWTDAFDLMHAKLSREYPFTEWKGIKWDVLYDTYSVRVADAQARDDKRAYYVALRQYIHSIPDGYMEASDEENFRQEAIGGGFGIAVAPLDNDLVVVYRIVKGGDAEKAGIKWGAQITQWNGKPIGEALKSSPEFWSHAPAATYVGRTLDRCMFLTRGPVGTTAKVTFKNRDAQKPQTATLTAQDDKYAGLGDVVRYVRDFSEVESPFESRTLQGGFGYINILSESTTLMTPFPDRAFKKIVEKLDRDKVPGLILDLRGNEGGDMALARAYAGHFVDAKRNLGQLVAFDAKKNGFALNEQEDIAVEPRQPHYDGRIIVLVHRSTRDSGQVIASALQGQSNVVVMGVLGTEGSLARVGGEITMPGGYVLHYPVGRYVDGKGNVLITTNAEGDGGVQPDIVIPATVGLFEAQFTQARDSLLDAALVELKRQTAAKK
jgi:carboxyl-terminal processing protease